MKEQLREYIINKFGEDKLEIVLNKNYLQFLFLDNPHNVRFFLNKAKVMSLEKELLVICALFDKKNIKYITFKGIALSTQLFENRYVRFFTDIDIFVPPENFETALHTLFDNGYSLQDDSSLHASHHVVLQKGKIIVELHKTILNPFMQINEEYMYEHLVEIELLGQKIRTFNVTATLLHLFYHLYMDTPLKRTNLHSLLTTKKAAKARIFLYRAYEIALFSQKHSEQIAWEEIINEIKTQKLKIVFKQMINDVLEIFPDAFPEQFVDAINNAQYDDKGKIVLHSSKQFVTLNVTIEEIESVLSNLIDVEWNAKANANIKIDQIGEFTLDNAIVRDVAASENYQFACKVTVEKLCSDVKLTFVISNDDFCFSDIGEYNTQNSDGVHLIVCGTERYSYNSIFLFPKIVDGKPIVIPVNVLNDVNSEIDDSLIQATYSATKTEYTITAILKDSFLRENSLENYFYLGLVISNCSSKTHKRKSDLILSNPPGEWYNPIYFAKIEQ